MPDAIRRLTLGCLLAGFAGHEVPDRLAQALADGLGGVVPFGSTIGDGTGLDRLTRELGAAGRPAVADGNVDRRNPVIGGRSFSESAAVGAPDRRPGQHTVPEAAVGHPDSVITDPGWPVADRPPRAPARAHGRTPGLFAGARA